MRVAKDEDRGYYSYKEIGKILGISAERVADIERVALRKIKMLMGADRKKSIMESVGYLSSKNHQARGLVALMERQ